MWNCITKGCGESYGRVETTITIVVGNDHSEQEWSAERRYSDMNKMPLVAILQTTVLTRGKKRV